MAALGDLASGLAQGSDSAPLYELTFTGEIATHTLLIALSAAPGGGTVSSSQFTSNDQSALESALQSAGLSGAHLKKYTTSSSSVF